MKTLILGVGVVLTGLVALSAADSSPAEKSRQLTAVVQSNATLAERARALQQLALVGTKDSVPVLAGLLADEKLGQYARDALEQMPDPAAGAALRAALDRLQGRALIGVIASLGVRREAAAVEPLGLLAAGSAGDVAAAALIALGRIGTSEARRLLDPALARNSAAVRAAAAEAAIMCADRLAAARDRAAARALYEKVRQADVPAAWRAVAMRGVILMAGPDGVKLLLEQLRSGSPEMREMALGTARELREPTMTSALVAELKQLTPPWQAAVTLVLADRGDEQALAALEATARAGAEDARVAALRGLGTIGRTSSLPIMLEAIRPPASEAITAAAYASLTRLNLSSTDAVILSALATAEPAVKVRLIGVLGERTAGSATPELMKLAAQTDKEIAKAAFRALGLVTSPAALPQLIALTTATTDDEVRSLADRAIVTTSMKVLEPARRAEAVLQAFQAASNPDTRAALLRPLGAIMRTMGGIHEVFFVVRAALKDSAAAVRAAAWRCLADWPDATPTTTLLEVAAEPDAPPAQRETALRGAIRMAGTVAAGREHSSLNVMDALGRANRLVRTKEERILIVAALGSVRQPEAVPLLVPYLDDPDVKAAAALAIVQVASALPGAKNSAELKGVLERIAASDQDGEVRSKAGKLAKGGAAPAPGGKAGAVAKGPLFSGVNLANWDGDPGVWRVRDGVIVGGSLLGNPRNEFLAAPRRYRNFVLRLEYKLVGTEGFVNGGVQFRSERVKQPPNEMSGYQADIGMGHSGCLYDESRRKKFLARATDEKIKRLEKAGDWNRYEIRCEGPRVELTLNGERTVTFTEDEPKVARDGLIALQIHGNCKAEISFRNLTIAELP